MSCQKSILYFLLKNGENSGQHVAGKGDDSMVLAGTCAMGINQ
jgi:hypothetical protein